MGEEEIVGMEVWRDGRERERESRKGVFFARIRFLIAGCSERERERYIAKGRR